MTGKGSLITRRVVATLCAITSVMGLTANAADESVWDRVSVSVAGFAPDINTSVRFDTPALQPGTELDLESDMNLSHSETLYQVLATVRLTDRISIDASYFQLARSGTATLNSEVRFGEAVFPVSADANTVFDNDVITASLGYALWKNRQLELMATFGAYFLSLNGGIDTGDGGFSESVSATAPMPLIGGRLTYKFTPRVSLLASAEYLSGQIQDFEGSISNYRVAMEFSFTQNFGAGLGYDAFNLELDSEYADFPGRLTFEYSGPKAFFTMKF